jgi:Ala-tRNA(Pro) deacylase
MSAKMLVDFLEREHVHYLTIQHAPAYTAQEVAASAHIPGKEVAKTVIVKVAGKMTMLVLPANRKIVLQELRETLGIDDIRFASEEEFRALFPDCETGAMPPFGNLYGLDVLVAPSLAEDEEIAFNAGSHTELVRMPYQEFARLVKPQIVSFTN